MTSKLTKNEIINLLPHREPMLLIDELVDIVKLKSAKAIVYVKKNSFFVDGHFCCTFFGDGLILKHLRTPRHMATLLKPCATD